MIAEATSGRRSTQARASWDMLRPASSATGAGGPTATSVASSSSAPIVRPILRDVARDPGGGALSGWYLPVSTPSASGDQTIWEIPCLSHRGMTSRSA